MAIVVGIDEAGYGPLLGPLVVSAAVFQMPDQLVGKNLWAELNGSVTAKPSRRRTSLAIADSKKLYRRREDLVYLERVVLAVLYAWTGRTPKDLPELLEIVAPPAANAKQQYPWYNHGELKLPVSAGADEIRIAGKMLAREIKDRRMQLKGLWSEALLEGEYNAMVGKTRNKASVLLALALSLVQKALQLAGNQNVFIYVDRHGGRITYRSALMQAFENYHLTVKQESHQASRYLLQRDRQELTIQFLHNGERHHMLVSLGSILSKYLRELFMRMYNTFWLSHQPEIKPTAGYWQDGQRFLAQIQPTIDRLGIDRARLVRQL